MKGGKFDWVFNDSYPKSSTHALEKWCENPDFIFCFSFLAKSSFGEHRINNLHNSLPMCLSNSHDDNFRPPLKEHSWVWCEYSHLGQCLHEINKSLDDMRMRETLAQMWVLTPYSTVFLKWGLKLRNLMLASRVLDGLWLKWRVCRTHRMNVAS